MHLTNSQNPTWVMGESASNSVIKALISAEFETFICVIKKKKKHIYQKCKLQHLFSSLKC